MEHGTAVKWLGHYLNGTSNNGVILKLIEKSFNVFADVDFAGNWDPARVGQCGLWTPQLHDHDAAVSSRTKVV
jgi:hypothetical protein